ncbi:MAG: toll/interleukin-1 receptor domain-containing protein [Ruminococcaceae bacterium]|nr:toll/interleukin-1 receptor domain-containing protein [Oscillospiraceae bacterium]
MRLEGQDMPHGTYEGSEPYIFVSYAHKDSARVLPVIEGLQAKGFRVWYDAGIEAGTEWPEYIAEHLMGANCVIAFISESALESPIAGRRSSLPWMSASPYWCCIWKTSHSPPACGCAWALCRRCIASDTRRKNPSSRHWRMPGSCSPA